MLPRQVGTRLITLLTVLSVLLGHAVLPAAAAVRNDGRVTTARGDVADVVSLWLKTPRAVSAGDPVYGFVTVTSVSGKPHVFLGRLSFTCAATQEVSYSSWYPGFAPGNGRLGVPILFVALIQTPIECSTNRFEPDVPTALVGLQLQDASGVTEHGDYRSLHIYRPLTASYYRVNLEMAEGRNPTAQAHHMLPRKFERQFAAAGLNIHDPRYMRWWCSKPGIPGNHPSKSREYNALWDGFFQEHPEPTKNEILTFMNSIQDRYIYTC